MRIIGLRGQSYANGKSASESELELQFLNPCQFIVAKFILAKIKIEP
jgi:hypothetical protein